MGKKNDMVNNPPHYAGGTSMECIDSMLAVLDVRGTIDFCLGNAYKYLWRHKLKGKPEEDLEKARWYVDRACILNNSYLFDTDIGDKTQALGGLCQLYRCVYDGNKALHTKKKYSNYNSDYSSDYYSTRKRYSDYYKGPEKNENKEAETDAILTTEDTHEILDCLENLTNGIDGGDYDGDDVLKDIARIINAINKEEVASQIADICIAEWDTYGIWPSVAIGQAFVESGLGVGPNLFGCLGHAGRGTVSATYGYLGVLQNQYFRGEANFAPTPESQLAIIMKGGRYCEGEHPGGTYYNNVINSIDRYGWRKHDHIINKQIQKKAEAKERKARQKLPFSIIFSSEVVPGTCIVDPEFIKKGSTVIYPGGIAEAINTSEGLDNTIIVGCERVIFPTKVDRTEFFDMEKLRFDIEVIEDAKG